MRRLDKNQYELDESVNQSPSNQKETNDVAKYTEVSRSISNDKKTSLIKTEIGTNESNWK